MSILNYLFPGFVLGPIFAGLIWNLVNGAGGGVSGDLGLAGMLAASAAFTFAFYLADRIIR